MTDKTKANPSLTSFQQDFAKTLRRYRKNCQYVKRLLEETDKSYDEIREKRVLTPGNNKYLLFFKNNLFSFFLDKISEIRLSKTDQQYIDCLSPRPLALIICSHRYNGKARFVNEFLSDSLLPESPTVKEDDIIRMIRIKVDYSLLIRKLSNRKNLFH